MSFLYADAVGITRGPFGTSQMQQWYADGYFTSGQMVREPGGPWGEISCLLPLLPPPAAATGPPAGVGGYIDAKFDDDWWTGRVQEVSEGSGSFTAQFLLDGKTVRFRAGEPDLRASASQDEGDHSKKRPFSSVGAVPFVEAAVACALPPGAILSKRSLERRRRKLQQQQREAVQGKPDIRHDGAACPATPLPAAVGGGGADIIRRDLPGEAGAACSDDVALLLGSALVASALKSPLVTSWEPGFVITRAEAQARVAQEDSKAAADRHADYVGVSSRGRSRAADRLQEVRAAMKDEAKVRDMGSRFVQAWRHLHAGGNVPAGRELLDAITEIFDDSPMRGAVFLTRPGSDSYKPAHAGGPKTPHSAAPADAHSAPLLRRLRAYSPARTPAHRHAQAASSRRRWPR
jgi:hypothetical protein